MFVSRFLILSMMTLSFLASGQGQFRVIIAEGRSYLKTNNGFHQVEVGEKVNGSASINLVDNSTLVLLDAKGRFLVLDKTGNYHLSKVSLNVLIDSSKIIHEIWTKHFENTISNYSNENQIIAPSADFELYLPSSSETYGFQLFLKWTNLENEHYRIDLLDEFENVFYKINTDKSHYILDLLLPELAWKRQVFVRITALQNKLQTGLTAIAKLSPSHLDDANTLLSKIPTDSSELIILTKAAFFEQKGWMADVHGLLYFMSKENELIRSYYVSFLERNNFRGLINEVRK